MIVRVAALSLLTLNIPKRSERGGYRLNEDSVLLDRRCLRRYQRKYVKEMRRRYGDKFITRIRVR